MSDPVGVGLIGLGTVGTGVVRLLRNAPPVPGETSFVLRRIAVRDPGRPRKGVPGTATLTGDALEVVRDPDVQMVVEVSGAPGAREWIGSALELGKDVVTANKAVVAGHGDELFRLALKHNADLRFEASVAGGIPIINSLREGLVANEVRSFRGILNGTTNYILTRMTRGAGDYAGILRTAQELGFAEPDPTMDVTGADAAQKLAILCRIAFGSSGTADDIFCEGVENIEPADIDHARQLGYTIKLLAIARRAGSSVEARVHPTMVPTDSLLANTHDEFNAIELEASAVGMQIFHGKGAGQLPTASAVLSDMVALARRRRSEARPAAAGLLVDNLAMPMTGIRGIESRFYLRLAVSDETGVLEGITRILASEGISIASLIQKERHLEGGSVPLVMVTHEAPEESMQRALGAMSELDSVRGDVRMIRILEPPAGSGS